MAEERLIDDDKDKKYRIRVNADGEEELVVETNPEQEEAEHEEIALDAPEEEDDDEKLLTPEQLAAKREREEKLLQEQRERVEKLIASAKADCAAGKFSTALEYLEQAEETDGDNGEIYLLRMKAYTSNFSDFSQAIKAAESAEKVKELTSSPLREEAYAVASPALESKIAELRESVTSLNKENEEKKAERAVVFKSSQKCAIITFCALFGLFAVLCGACGYFASVIYSVANGTNLILTCVFGGLAFAAFIALVLVARWLNIACRRVRLNNKNTSTALGREFLAKQADLKACIAIRDALNFKQ